MLFELCLASWEGSLPLVSYSFAISVAAMLRSAVLLFALFALSNARVYLGKLSERQHEVRGNVYAISCKELVIENFYYDGFGPQVFAYIGTNPASGPTRNSRGADATVLYNNNRFQRFPPGRHTNTMLRIFLPSSYHLNQIRWLSIWCRRFSANFGHITFPVGDLVVQDVCSRKVFCQQLREGYDMCWSVNNTAGSVQITLCSNILGKNRYMGFGISKSLMTTQMFNSDPALCWYDNEGKWTIQDYYISAYAQCGASGQTILGVCADTRYTDGADNLTMTKGQEVDGVACCTYTRPLNSSDTQRDNPISLAGPQAVVWAMGPVNQGVILQHPSGFRAVPNVLVDFGNGSDATLCDKISTEDCCKDHYRVENGTGNQTTSPPPKCKPCEKRRNQFKASKRQFVFTIGPSQGACGYEKLTNSSGGWGIAWYVDGCLIPHLKVQRGRTYTFCVLGGNDSSLPSSYHPLYLTDSPLGGYFQSRYNRMPMNETIYAGIDKEDNALFTGPLTEHKAGDVKRCCTKRKPKCPRGTKKFTWRPTRDTPDELYYQCATHYFLGWKISVRDKPRRNNN